MTALSTAIGLLVAMCLAVDESYRRLPDQWLTARWVRGYIPEPRLTRYDGVYSAAPGAPERMMEAR
jgi:hypothetical protein